MLSSYLIYREPHFFFSRETPEEVFDAESTEEVGKHLISRKPAKGITRLTRAKRIRLAFKELGPTFIKLGQLRSTRSDLINREYYKELRIMVR